MSQAVPCKMFFQRSFLMMHCVFNEMKFDHGITVCYIYSPTLGIKKGSLHRNAHAIERRNEVVKPL